MKWNLIVVDPLVRRYFGQNVWMNKLVGVGQDACWNNPMYGFKNPALSDRTEHRLIVNKNHLQIID